MTVKSTVAAEGRAEKYARVLPRLTLEHAQLATGQAIVVVLDKPLDELCDIAIRLIHPSGRIYAQRDCQLGPDMDRIEIGKGAAAPGGSYDVVITPPLAEFFSTTRAERRLPCFIGDSADGYRHRCAELLKGAGHGSGDAPLMSLLADTLPVPTSPEAVSGDDVPVLEALAAAYLSQDTDAARLSLALQDIGRMGFFLTPDQLTATLVALAALVEHAKSDDIADLAVAVIDKLVFCIALDTIEAPESNVQCPALDEIISALRHLLWGDGHDARRPKAALALAMAARYEPPALFAAIAKAAPADPGFQRHRLALRDGASGIHIQSPYCVSRFGDTLLDIRVGDEGIRLDFSTPNDRLTAVAADS